MAKNSVRDFDATAANNTDIQSVDIAENCAPSGINNAIRELMTDLKNVSTGTIALESPQADSMTVTGDLTVDTNTLFVDASANAVGLGTLTPSTTLDVVRAGVQPLRVESSSGTEVAINMVNTGGNVQLEAHSGNFNIDADAVGIGTSSPQQLLEVENTSGVAQVNITADQSSQSILALGDENNQYVQHIVSDHSDNSMRFHTAAASGTNERMRIDSTGDVGIGTSSPGHPLHVSGNGFGTIAKFSADDGANNPRLLIYGSSDGMHIQRTSGSGAANLMFEVGGAEGGGTEAARLASSGDLFVSKTSQNVDTVGHELRADGVTVHTADGAAPLFLNRQTSDGAIVTLMKAGSTVGSISNISTTLYVGSGDTNLRFNRTASDIRPVYSTGLNRDNVIDLGDGNARFDDVYATNGTIQTSDQNEKQQIASLTDAEITAAKAISALFKTFKWNDSVTENGDNARTHTGVIAQEVQSALTDAGLDATKYAFFCSDTWWETQTEVPAVEAVDAVTETQTDDDGNEVEVVVKEAVEAQDAYTRTDTYDTVEEAPEGATERTRLGIRYPELLAFVGAATEQRLADIETRLTALEA